MTKQQLAEFEKEEERKFFEQQARVKDAIDALGITTVQWENIYCITPSAMKWIRAFDEAALVVPDHVVE